MHYYDREKPKFHPKGEKMNVDFDNKHTLKEAIQTLRLNALKKEMKRRVEAKEKFEISFKYRARTLKSILAGHQFRTDTLDPKTGKPSHLNKTNINPGFHRIYNEGKVKQIQSLGTKYLITISLTGHTENKIILVSASGIVSRYEKEKAGRVQLTRDDYRGGHRTPNQRILERRARRAR